VQSPDLFRSTGFRLVAWYAAVFGVSVAILLGVVYWIAIAAVEQQLDDSVLRESRLLADVYATRGREALERGFNRRTNELSSPRRYYLFQDASGGFVAGNLAPMAPREGRFVMPVPELNGDAQKDGGPDTMVAQGWRLSAGEFLLVGENRYRLVKTREAIISAIGWGTAITVLLALGGGIVLAVGYLRRIEEVNRAIRSIMDGDLSKRVPTRGGRDEMDHLAENLNAMLERIQALMESLKRVSDDIAHDLRTPLSRLRQRLESARSSGQASVIEQSIAEVDAILDTFTALLRIAQIESGTRRSAFAQVNLSQVLSTVVETYSAVAEDRGHRMHASIASGAHVQGDRELILQMIANLVENAIQHMGPGGDITLELSEDAGAPVLRVRDTGCGIPQLERAKVFRRFYRLERSRTTSGSGLGLALVKAVVELHAATIELGDNDPGLCVTVRFRRCEAGDQSAPLGGETRVSAAAR
jgi:signal transduction histidine kinase